MTLAEHPMTATLLLITFALAFDPVPKVIAEPLPPEPKRDPTNVQELYDAYRYYGLPLPPKGSYLVQYQYKLFSTSDDGKRTLIPHTKLVLVHDEASSQKYSHHKRVEPTRDAFERIHGLPVGMEFDRYDPRVLSSWFIFSAQAHHLGWKDSAQWSFELGRGDIRALKETAWFYHLHTLTDPKSDRRIVLSRLLRAYNPNDSKSRDKQNKVHDDLRNSIRPDWNRNGLPEDTIDGMVQGRKTIDDLLSHGFDAVPVMIRHLTDHRMTRGISFFECVMNEQYRFECLGKCPRVSDICRRHLQLSMRDESSSRFDRRLKEDSDSIAVWNDNCARETMEWYERVKLIGEEKWSFTYPLGRLAKSTIAQKYPLRLSEIINRHAGKPGYYTDLLEMVVNSRLPLDEKKKLLRIAEKYPQTWPPLQVINYTDRIDSERSRYLLANFLDRISRRDPQTPGVESLDCFLLLEILQDFNSPSCWEKYRTIIPQMSDKTRSLLIDRDFLFDIDTSIFERMKCHLACLNDTTPLQTEKTKDGEVLNLLITQSGYKSLTLADLAAIKLAEEFEIDIPWKPDRTPAEWSKIRDQVRIVAEKEIAKK
jgi:hypothetical protein